MNNNIQKNLINTNHSLNKMSEDGKDYNSQDDGGQDYDLDEEYSNLELEEEKEEEDSEI